MIHNSWNVIKKHTQKNQSNDKAAILDIWVLSSIAITLRSTFIWSGLTNNGLLNGVK